MADDRVLRNGDGRGFSGSSQTPRHVVTSSMQLHTAAGQPRTVTGAVNRRSAPFCESSDDLPNNSSNIQSTAITPSQRLERARGNTWDEEETLMNNAPLNITITATEDTVVRHVATERHTVSGAGNRRSASFLERSEDLSNNSSNVQSAAITPSQRLERARDNTWDEEGTLMNNAPLNITITATEDTVVRHVATERHTVSGAGNRRSYSFLERSEDLPNNPSNVESTAITPSQRLERARDNTWDEEGTLMNNAPLNITITATEDTVVRHIATERHTVSGAGNRRSASFLERSEDLPNNSSNVQSTAITPSQRLERARGSTWDEESTLMKNEPLNTASTAYSLNGDTPLLHYSIDQRKMERKLAHWTPKDTFVPRIATQQRHTVSEAGNGHSAPSCEGSDDLPSNSSNVQSSYITPNQRLVRARGNILDEEGTLINKAPPNIANTSYPPNSDRQLVQCSIDQRRMARKLAHWSTEDTFVPVRARGNISYEKGTLMNKAPPNIANTSYPLNCNRPLVQRSVDQRRMERNLAHWSTEDTVFPENARDRFSVSNTTVQQPGNSNQKVVQETNERDNSHLSKHVISDLESSTSRRSMNQMLPTQELQAFQNKPTNVIVSQERDLNTESRNLRQELNAQDPLHKINEICLRHLVAKRKLQISEFTVSSTNASPRLFSACVMIGDYPFYSHEQCYSPEEAKEAAAKDAYTFLLDFYTPGKTTTNVSVVITRLKEMLTKHAGLSSSIPLWYKVTYKEHLPCDWLDIAKESAEFSVYKQRNGVHAILFSQNMESCISSQHTSPSQLEHIAKSTTEYMERDLCSQFPRLNISKHVYNIPWSEAIEEIDQTENEMATSEQRNVGIINQQVGENIVSESVQINKQNKNPAIAFGSIKDISNKDLINNTVKFPDDVNLFQVSVFIVQPDGNAYIRIINEECKDLYAKLDVLHDVIREKKAKECVVGNYYCVYDDESWQRVRLEEINESNVTVYFIDWGDTVKDKYTLNDLYDLPKELKKYRAQAVVCRFSHVKFPTLSYVGYEDIYNRISTCIHENILLKSSFMAEVDRTSNPHSLILYDEKSGENMNLIIMTEVVATLTMPVKVAGTGQSAIGRVAHINEHGAAFLHMNVENMDILTSHLKMLTERIIDGKIPVNASKQLFCGVLYLYLDHANGSGYRVKVLQNLIGDNMREIDVFMVDFGKVKTVCKKDLFELKLLCNKLICVHPQAVETTLIEVSKTVDTRIVERVKNAYPEKTLVSVRTISAKASSVPVVSLTKLRNSSSPDDSDISNSVSGFLSEQCPSSNTEQSNNVEEMPKVLEYPLPMIPSDHGVQVQVLQPISPSEFWIQLIDMKEDYDCMLSELQNYYNSVPKSNSKVELQSACAIFCGESWRRGLLMNHGYQTIVWLVDEGAFRLADNDEIRPLDERFASLPYRAIPAYLFGVKPVNSDWSIEDCARFRELVVGKDCVAVFKGRLESYKKKQGLYLFDCKSAKTMNDADICETLVSENRAIDTE